MCEIIFIFYFVQGFNTILNSEPVIYMSDKWQQQVLCVILYSKCSYIHFFLTYSTVFFFTVNGKYLLWRSEWNWESFALWTFMIIIKIFDLFSFYSNRNDLKWQASQWSLLFLDKFSQWLFPGVHASPLIQLLAMAELVFSSNCRFNYQNC